MSDTVQEPRAAAPAAPARFHLPKMPALDGLRGLAVAGVLLYHADVLTGHRSYLPGGYLGVDLFFVLSGFLITALLLAEIEGSGTISLQAFWARRARRLLPALFGLLLGVVVYARLWSPAIDLGEIRGAGLAALVYVSNWRDILHGANYWDISKSPSPLQHLWSLAIEEQFYVVWPLVVVAATRGRSLRAAARRTMTVALSGAALSLLVWLVTNLLSASDVRMYEGTDTRAFGLLIGAALGSWWQLERRRTDGPSPLARAFVTAGPAAALALGAAWVMLDGRSPVLLQQGGLPACSVLAVIVLAASVVPGGGIPGLDRILRLPPLTGLGQISYGLYLWHWPVFLVLSEVRVGISGWWLLFLRIDVSLVLALVSYSLIEKRIRRGAIENRIALAGVPATMAVLAVALLVVTRGAVSAGQIQEDIQPNPGVALSAPDPVAPGAPTVLYVGDSVTLSLGAYPERDAAGYGVNVYNGSAIGCALIYEGNRTRGDAGNISTTTGCVGRWDDFVRQVKPSVVVALLASESTVDVEIGGRFVTACSDAYHDELKSRIEEQVRLLGSTGAKVALLTRAPSTSVFRPADSDEMTDCLNDTIRESAESSGAVVIDVAGFLCPDGTCTETYDGAPVRPDSVHYTGPGGVLVARWLTEQVLQLTG